MALWGERTLARKGRPAGRPYKRNIGLKGNITRAHPDYPKSIALIVRLKLFSPLSDAAGASELTLALEEPATLQTVVEALVSRFGEKMKRHFYDLDNRIIPSWAVFLNHEIIPLNRPDALRTKIAAGDELSFILNIAGG